MINRKYLQRIIDVTANVAPGKDLGGASQAVQRVLDELPPPEGFTVRLGGQTEAQKKAFGGLSFAALLAIALVYMVLASQFKSLLDPLVIMFSVPLGVTGVFLALWLTGTTLSREQLHGHHHDGRHRGVERRAAGRLRERAASARQAADRGDHRRRADAAAADPDDDDRDDRRPDADGARASARGARPTCRWRARSSAG